MQDIVISDGGFDFGGNEWKGTFQRLLDDNVGKLVRAEYESGSGAPTVFQGVIYAVGKGYLLLWDEARKTYSTGNLQNLRSLVFYPKMN